MTAEARAQCGKADKGCESSGPAQSQPGMDSRLRGERPRGRRCPHQPQLGIKEKMQGCQYCRFGQQAAISEHSRNQLKCCPAAPALWHPSVPGESQPHTLGPELPHGTGNTAPIQVWPPTAFRLGSAGRPGLGNLHLFMPLGSVLTNLGTGSAAEATPIWHCQGTDHASQAGFHPVLVSLLMPAESTLVPQHCCEGTMDIAS